MTFTLRLGALAALTGVMLAASPAAAQYINSDSNTSKAPTYVAQGAFDEQPLVTPRGDLSVYVGPLSNPKLGTSEEAGFHLIRIPLPSFGEGDSGETAMFLQAGLAYGLAKNLEIGLFTPAWLIAPEAGNGDLPLFVTWATSNDNVDVAVRNTVTIPLQEASVWRWNPGLHMMARFERGLPGEEVDRGWIGTCSVNLTGNEPYTDANGNSRAVWTGTVTCDEPLQPHTRESNDADWVPDDAGEVLNVESVTFETPYPNG